MHEMRTTALKVTPAKAGVPLLLSVALFVSPAPAQVAIPADASAPPAIVQAYAPSPAIWKLADEDTTIYLFGTNHALPEGFKWRSPAFDAVVREADALILEAAGDAPKTAEAQAAIAQMMAPSEERLPILDRVSPDKRAALAAAIEAAGVPRAALDRAPTWFAAFGLAIAQLERSGMERSHGVEEVLEKEFAAAGKPIGEIEDPLAVLRNLDAMDEAAQVALLEQAAAIAPGAGKAVDPLAVDHAWAQGSLAPIAAEMTPANMGEALYAVLVESRNAAWVDWLVNCLDRPGTILVAVGAGHLVGPDSVQAMLEARGLETERID